MGQGDGGVGPAGARFHFRGRVRHTTKPERHTLELQRKSKSTSTMVACCNCWRAGCNKTSFRTCKVGHQRRAPHKGPSSARCWPIYICTPWTSRCQSWATASRQDGAGYETKVSKASKTRCARRQKRTLGESMRTIIDDLTPMIRGWFGYFKHAHPHTFTNLDGLIRRRLRSILRKQEKSPAQQAKPVLFVLGYRDDMLASDPGFGVVCSAVCWGSSSCPLRWVALGGWRAVETKSLSQAGRISQVVSTSSPLPPSRS